MVTDLQRSFTCSRGPSTPLRPAADAGGSKRAVGRQDFRGPTTGYPSRNRSRRSRYTALMPTRD